VAAEAMKLIPVDPGNEAHLKALYELLAERDASQSISHKKMPTWIDHVAFVRDMDPYRGAPDKRYRNWDLIKDVNGATVGALYLSMRDEIGISIFRLHQRRGYATRAIKQLIAEYGLTVFYANINPANEPSRKMFEKLGFKLVQHTYALEAE
jgi:RimJ/RimL family protein N-acetyltransferase